MEGTGGNWARAVHPFIGPALTEPTFWACGSGAAGDRHHPSESMCSPPILAARQVSQQKEQPKAQGCVPGAKEVPAGSTGVSMGRRALEGSGGSWCGGGVSRGLLGRVDSMLQAGEPQKGLE